MYYKMRSLLIVVLAFFAITLNAQDILPDVNIKTLDGETVNLQDYGSNEKITIISFWATWCSPCKKELDAIADMYEGWQEDYDVELLAITIDTQRALAKVPGMVESKGWDYTVLSDANQDLQKALNFQTVPYTLVVDKEGKIVYTHSGYLPGDEYELEDKLKEIAGK